jgi:surfeit locus 1 family protein
MITAVVVLSRLGGCQLDRAAAKDERVREFSSAPEFEQLPSTIKASEFAIVSLKGKFRSGKDILADNQIHEGQAGVHVYSVFETITGENILVNRGWLALPLSREPLPVIETPSSQVEIKGRIGNIPVPGRQLGQEKVLSKTQWPQLLTYPKLERISKALQLELYDWILFLDEDSPGGFAGRQWKPVFMSPDRHRAYAVQWYALALVAVFGWGFATYRRGTNS